MCKKHKKVCRLLNYIEHSLIAISTITGCVSISAFASLVGVPIGITSFAIGLKICVITAGIKKRKSIMKKKRKKHDKIVSLAKSKLSNIKVFNKWFAEGIIYIKQCCLIFWSVEKIQKVKTLKL